jgi:protein-disulfide isomerase
MLRPTRTTLLYSGVLLLLGLGIGSSGTLLVQKWVTTAATPERPRPDAPAEPKLAADLLLQGEPRMGSDAAPLTIVEFSDFECPYCKHFHEQVLPQLKKEYVDTGLVRFVHKDLPLPFHQNASAAAAAARCADEQNRYWEMYAAIFDQQTCLECKGVSGIAVEQELNSNALQACMQRDSTKAMVNANLSEAELHNIRATPTFVVGPTLSEDSHRGDIVEGAMPWPQFKAILEKHLKALNKP